MSRAAWGALLLLSAACAGTPRRDPPPVQPAPPVRLAFSPPLGVELRDTSVTERTNRAGDPDGGAVVREALTVETLSRFDAVDGGVRLTQRATSLVAERNGRPLVDPLLALATAFSVEIELASDGSFVRLSGTPGLEEAVRKAFPDPRDADRARALLTPTALEEQARREWEAGSFSLLSRRLRVGAPLYAVESVEVGDRTATFLVERALEPTPPAPGQLSFRQRCLGSLEDGPNHRAQEEAWTEAGAPALAAGVRCEGRQVFSAAAFRQLASSQRVRLKLEASASASGPAVTFELVRTRVAVERGGAP